VSNPIIICHIRFTGSPSPFVCVLTMCRKKPAAMSRRRQIVVRVFPNFDNVIVRACSKAWLKIGVNDVIHSKIPHGLNYNNNN